MIQEQFPERASLRPAVALWRDQGVVQSCTAQSLANAISRLLPFEPSARFIWWGLRGKEKSIESAVAVLREKGCCTEELCPYELPLLDTPPSPEAFADAEGHQFPELHAIQIDGADSVKRAICEGSPVVFKMRGEGSVEHASCIDGYGPDGAYVWDSNSIYPALVFPWEDFASGGRVTQMRRLGGLLLIPNPEYIPEEVPTLLNGILSLPKAMVYVGFPEPSLHFRNVHLQLVEKGELTSDNDDVRDIIFWHTAKRTLYLPRLNVDGLIKYRVKIVGPTATLISGEQL